MDEKQKTIDFGIRGIIVFNFNINLNDRFAKIEQEAGGKFNAFTFEVSCFNKSIVPENLINVEVTVKVFLDVEKKIELGNLKIGNIFNVKDLNLFYDAKENKLDLPVNFEATLIGISISHARAILMTKCAGTFLQNAMLPVMNPMDFLKRK